MPVRFGSFSALQRAEIAEMFVCSEATGKKPIVSVLFNEPKLLKLFADEMRAEIGVGFSALQRAEIAEIEAADGQARRADRFQCSSTSRNC